jgi:hypothetical protein
MKLGELRILLRSGQLIDCGLLGCIFFEHQDHAVKDLAGRCASDVVFETCQRMDRAGYPAQSAFIDGTLDAVSWTNA